MSYIIIKLLVSNNNLKVVCAVFPKLIFIYLYLNNNPSLGKYYISIRSELFIENLLFKLITIAL